jgi:hypothetical protein
MCLFIPSRKQYAIAKSYEKIKFRVAEVKSLGKMEKLAYTVQFTSVTRKTIFVTNVLFEIMSAYARQLVYFANRHIHGITTFILIDKTNVAFISDFCTNNPR